MRTLQWILLVFAIGIVRSVGVDPSSSPTIEPSSTPSHCPSAYPSSQPTSQPFGRPSSRPTCQPSSQPSKQPTGKPTGQPSVQPSRQPSRQPTTKPSTHPSSQPTRQPTSLPTSQPSGQPSEQPVLRPTSRPSRQPTNQPSKQPTAQPSASPTSQPFGYPSGKPSAQPVAPPTSQPTVRPSSHPSQDPSSQPTSRPSRQPSSRPSSQPVSRPTGSPTSQPSRQPSVVPTSQPSKSPTGQPSGKPSGQPTHQPSSSPTDQPTVWPSSAPSLCPSTQPSSQPSQQPTTRPSSQPTSRPSDAPSSQPSRQPSVVPTAQPSTAPTTQPSTKPSVQPSRQPSSNPTGQPSSQPTRQPSATPSSAPSVIPTSQPSQQPTRQPSARPSSQPSSYPSSCPSGQPTVSPSHQSTSQPTSEPTGQPSLSPTRQPSARPSSLPTAQPTWQPSSQPTCQPTGEPSGQPSSMPSVQPTRQPSAEPSAQPSAIPSRQPSSAPSSAPSGQPSARPSKSPSAQPSSRPSAQPTCPTSQPTSQPTSKPTGRPDCPAGTRYVNSPSGFYCVDCDPGFTSEARSDTCTACAPGTYAPTNASSSCLPCPLGSYQPKGEASICLQCPAGFVTGATGSIARAQCVSPIINFANGGVALGAFLLFGWIYLGHGRLLRVALHRFFNMVKLSIILAGSVAYMMDLTMLAGAVMTRIERQQPRRRFARVIWFFKSVVFVVLSVLIMAVCVAGTVIYYFFHSVFNALVIWRGYERLIPRIRVNFSGYIELLVERLHIYIPWAVPWEYLLFPVQFIVTSIASLKIDLSAVQVTCRGAQAAGYLFINFLVANFIVLIIASDWQVYWTTAWQRLLGRNVFLLSNRHYLRYARGTGVYHAVSALVLGLLPEPKKWIQYALGFVSLQIFFADDGHSPYDTTCDDTTLFPIDTALAYGATVAAALMLFPTIFVIAQVLVPSFTFRRPYHPLVGQLPPHMQPLAQETEFNSLEWTHRALGISNGDGNSAASPSSVSSSSTKRANRMSKRFHHHPLSRRRHERLQEVVRTPTSPTGSGTAAPGGGSSPSTPRTPSSSARSSTNRRQFTFSSQSDRSDMQTCDASIRTHRSSNSRNNNGSSSDEEDGGKVHSDSDEEAKVDASTADARDPNAQVVYCCRGERKWISYFLSVFSSLLAFDWFSMRGLGQFGVGWFKINRRFHETYVQHFAEAASADLALTSPSAEEVEHLQRIMEEARRIRMPAIPVLLLPMVSKKDGLPAQLWRQLQLADGDAAADETARNEVMMDMLREETDAAEGNRRSTRRCLSCGSCGNSSKSGCCRSCMCCGCCCCCCGGGSGREEMDRLFDRGVVNRCKVEGRIAWLFHQEEFFSYKDVMELVRRDVVDGFPLWCDTRDTAFAIPLLSAGIAQLLWPLHLLLSPHGRGIWWRVLKNYVYLGMVSLGIWTDASVDDFRVFARYEDFKRSLAFMSKQTLSSSSLESQRMRFMANPLASSTARAASGGDTSAGATTAGAASSSSSSSSSPLADLFTAYGIPYLDDASEDPQELLQYVASNIASRVVLLQLVPYLTAVSVVMADIATCPMFLFSSKLRSRLPPYILWTPFEEARRLLRHTMQWKAVDAQRRRSMRVDLEAGQSSAAGGGTTPTHIVEKDPPVWMVWFLGQKLFVTQSLLVRFVVSLTVNFMSLALVFLPTIILDFALLVMVAVMVLMGISVGLYAILLLHRFMFPNAFDADEVPADSSPSSSSSTAPPAPPVDPPVVPPPVVPPPVERSEATAPASGNPSATTKPTAQSTSSSDTTTATATTTTNANSSNVDAATDTAAAGEVAKRSAEGGSSNPPSLDRPRPSSTEVTVITMVTMITVVSPNEAVLGESSSSTTSSRRIEGTASSTSSHPSGGTIGGISDSQTQTNRSDRSNELVRRSPGNSPSTSSRQTASSISILRQTSSISSRNTSIQTGFTSSLQKMSTTSAATASPATPSSRPPSTSSTSTSSAASAAKPASRLSSTPTITTASSSSAGPSASMAPSTSSTSTSSAASAAKPASRLSSTPTTSTAPSAATTAAAVPNSRLASTPSASTAPSASTTSTTTTVAQKASPRDPSLSL